MLLINCPQSKEYSGSVFRTLVENMTYVDNLLGFLIPQHLLFIDKYIDI